MRINRWWDWVRDNSNHDRETIEGMRRAWGEGLELSISHTDFERLYPTRLKADNDNRGWYGI